VSSTARQGPSLPSALAQVVVWAAALGALIMWPAGTLAYPGAWAFLALFGVGGAAMVWWLARYSPALLRERFASPLQREQKVWDRVWLSLFVLAFLGWLALMGWDAGRTGFTAVPPWLQALGGLGIIANMAGTWWTFRENTFAAPVVKIQEGQRVIDTGPYAFVRHPMYTSALFLFFGIPLLLGSWLGLVLSLVLVPGLAWRAVHEERVLRAELPGYEQYAARVRYRLIPHVW
jgi:protein-S-isoprenylcysteine O-methyltransferase Ste14